MTTLTREWEPEVGCKLYVIESYDNELTLAKILREQLKDKERSEVITFLEGSKLLLDGEDAW